MSTAEVGGGNATQSFREWLETPIRVAEHPELRVRRAVPDDFPAIYDFLAQVFGVRRSHAPLDWIYRHNPLGPARCWVVEEKSHGTIVANRTEWPWPIRCGGDALPATLGGDMAVAPHLQGRGALRLLFDAINSHAGEDVVRLAWMNARSMAAARRKPDPDRMIASLPRRVMPLRTSAELARAGWRGAAVVVGRGIDITMRLRRRLRLGARRLRTEIIDRFDSSFDDLVDRHAFSEGLWCRHDAAFLNWRYLDLPQREHVALAVLDAREVPLAFSVLRVDGAHPYLMDFVAPRESSAIARELLAATVDTAIETGCTRLDFFAPPAWPHGALLRRGGFIRGRSALHCYAHSPAALAGLAARQLSRWQFVPGDHDAI